MQEHFRKRINEISLGWIRTMLGNIHDKNSAVESLCNIQEITQDDYDGRFLYELFQNAKDVSGCSKIKIVLQNGKLLFCNNGLPITDKDFNALCSHAISSKRDNDDQTGKFGIGKASYYEISETNHRVYSKASEKSREFDGYCFELASDNAIQYQTNLLDLHIDSVTPFGDIRIFDKGYTEHYIQDIINNDPDGIQRQQGLDRIRKNLAIPLNEIPEDVEDLVEEFSTVFYFVPDKADDVEKNLDEFSARILDIFLFLPERIKEISVVCNGTTTNYYRYTESKLSEYGETRIRIGKECSDEKEEKRFFIWEKIASDTEREEIYSSAPEKIKQRDPLKITIALAPDDIDNEGIYFCDLPTEESTGMNLYVDANFHIRSDRKSIHFDNDYNKKLLDFCASAVKDIVQRVLAANNGVPCVETARLITELLYPWRYKSKDSQIYNAIAAIIPVAELPCIWAEKDGKDVWTSPEEVFKTLDITWTDNITSSEFYRRSGLPILKSDAIALFDGFIDFFTGHAPKEIDRILQQTILFDFLKERFREHEKYLNTWRDIIEHWSDLLDENLCNQQIFLVSNGELCDANTIYRFEIKNDLRYPQDVNACQYPFFMLEKNLSRMITENLSRFDYLLDSSTINVQWCSKLIEYQTTTDSTKEQVTVFCVLASHFFDIIKNDQFLLDKIIFPCSKAELKILNDSCLSNDNESKISQFLKISNYEIKENINFSSNNKTLFWKQWCSKLIEYQNNEAESPDELERIFVILIQCFFDAIKENDCLLEKILFPCNNNEWHFLENIYQGNGWGAADNSTYEFLKLCGCSNKIVYLRSKNAKIWKSTDKFEEKVRSLVKDKLQRKEILIEYQGMDCTWGAIKNTHRLLPEMVEIPRGKGSYKFSSTSNYLFFSEDVFDFSENLMCFIFPIIQSFDLKRLQKEINNGIYFERCGNYLNSSLNFSIESPLKTFLKNQKWVPAQNGDLIKPTEIFFLSKDLRDKYPELSVLENIEKSSVVKEGLRDLLVSLGAQECSAESELPYDQVFKCLKNNKESLETFLKNFWKQLALGILQDVKLPQLLPVRNSRGKHDVADLENTTIYVADVAKRDTEEYREQYYPYLDIDIDLFNNEMYCGNKNLFTRYSLLPNKYIIDNSETGSLSSTALIDFAQGNLAFSILLFYSKNKKSILNKMRNLFLFKANSIVKRIGECTLEKSFCFLNNTFIAKEKKWAWGIAKGLHEWDSHINESIINEILTCIKNGATLTEIIDLMTELEVDFDDSDVAEAKELLWGFDKAKKLALQFIPSVRELEDEFAKYNSWEDIESKSLLLDLETLKKFFNSTLPLVQRGKVLAKDYEIDLQKWNTVCEELGEGCYVNKQFDAEFDKLRGKKQDFFLTCLLSKTVWNADNHFLYNVLNEWNDFDASDYADKSWQVDDDAFEKIINGFISQKYAAAEQENAVDKPYTIFQKNLEAWEAMGENADIDIYSNDYFLKEYPAEYFEIPPDEPEEDIVEAEEEVAVEESKPKSVPTVSAEKTSSAQVQSAHKVSIDSESVRSRVVKSTNERENHPTVRSVSPTSSEREGATASTAASQEKDISEIVNWKKLEVKFTAYKDITTANGGSNTSAPHSQRNYSPSDSVSETENLSDRDKAYIGKHGEECLFAYLNASFDNVKWVSTNNSQGIPGDDSLGYDFEIIDGDGKSQYIECKTTTGTTGTAEIHLGPTELSKAQECLPTENYSVYRVFPHGDQLQIVDLGNPLAEGNSVISFCGLKFRWRKK